MIRKLAQFEQASSLRKRGFTYAEIAKIVGVSKGTISAWISRETWSKDVALSNKKRASRENGKRISLLNTARKNQHAKQYSEAERGARTEYKHYRSSPLFIAGVTTYLTIGDHGKTTPIRVTSSNMSVHRIFIAFIEEYLGVPRENIRFWLLLYADLKPEECSRKWAKEIGVPLSRFHKYQVVSNKLTKSTLHFGVGNTIIGNTVMKRKLMKWIELLQKDL